jgi:DNA topoisomerase-2
MSKSIEDRYKKLTDIEHCLHRPGTYVGNTKPHKLEMFIPKSLDSYEMEYKEVSFIPAFIKLFDEVITNCVDASKIEGSKLNTVKVNVTPEGRITVTDNGGIPVVIHKVYEQYVPEIIFFELRSGSNYNDDDQRTGAGTNGLGSKLTNIFSKYFSVTTCDGENKFHQEATDNLHVKSKVKISKSSKNGTIIDYIPDYEYFKMRTGDGIESDYGLDETHLKLIYKRVLDVAGCNANLKVYFNDVKIDIKNFQEYSKIFCDDVMFDKDNSWDIGIGYSENGFKHSSFVNSVITYKGGNHVEFVSEKIISKIREFITKKYKTDIRPSDIRNHVFLFVNASVVNPAFDSQTKEFLITESKEFNGTGDRYNYVPTQTFLNKIFKSEIVESISDWLDKKAKADENKELRALNKALSKKKVEGLIDCSTTNRSEAVLGLFEGMSALNGVRKYRNAQKFAAFPLGGKFINVSELTPKKVMENEEAQKLMSAIGLRMGEEPDWANLRYGSILFFVDADTDGTSIACLLTNFFYKYWPQLFERGMIFLVLTPIVVSSRNGVLKHFYTEADFEDFVNSGDSKGWTSTYKKGLSALDEISYKEMMDAPVKVMLSSDADTARQLNVWFGKDPAERKKLLAKD